MPKLKQLEYVLRTASSRHLKSKWHRVRKAFIDRKVMGAQRVSKRMMKRPSVQRAIARDRVGVSDTALEDLLSLNLEAEGCDDEAPSAMRDDHLDDHVEACDLVESLGHLDEHDREPFLVNAIARFLEKDEHFFHAGSRFATFVEAILTSSLPDRLRSDFHCIDLVMRHWRGCASDGQEEALQKILARKTPAVLFFFPPASQSSIPFVGTEVSNASQKHQ